MLFNKPFLRDSLDVVAGYAAARGSAACRMARCNVIFFGNADWKVSIARINIAPAHQDGTNYKWRSILCTGEVGVSGIST